MIYIYIIYIYIYIQERDCFTMVRPVTDESLLQKLSSTPSEQLRPEFVTQVCVCVRARVLCVRVCVYRS